MIIPSHVYYSITISTFHYCQFSCDFFFILSCRTKLKNVTSTELLNPVGPVVPVAYTEVEVGPSNFNSVHYEAVRVRVLLGGGHFSSQKQFSLLRIYIYTHTHLSIYMYHTLMLISTHCPISTGAYYGILS